MVSLRLSQLWRSLHAGDFRAYVDDVVAGDGGPVGDDGVLVNEFAFAVGCVGVPN